MRESDWLLLVDDDDGIRDALCELLTAEGLAVEAASDGAAALKRLANAESLPSVILLDLMMPVMDGFAFRSVQLSEPRLADIPVLVFTTGTIDDRVHRLKAAGYHRKPVDIDNLLVDLREYVTAGD
jgi:CheY-like chemotaxis protein